MSEAQNMNVGTGIISKNDYKQKDTHPDKRGRCKIKGIWFWISSWEKNGANGPFDSLSFTEMTADEAAKYEAKEQARLNPKPQQGSFGGSQQQQVRQQAPANQQPPSRPEGAPNPDANQDFDDDIPF